MRHLTECLPDCDGWPCRCPCHDDATEYHSVTCFAGGFDGFDCDHSGHVSAGQPADCDTMGSSRNGTAPAGNRGLTNDRLDRSRV